MDDDDDDAGLFNQTQTPHATSHSRRCILATADWALSLRSLVWFFSNFDRGFPRDTPVAYWILSSQSIMNQSNFADVHTVSSNFPPAFDLNKINLKYRETLGDIIEFGASLHVAYGSSYQPLVVAIHGVDKIVDASYALAARRRSKVEQQLCRALAVLRDGLDQHQKRTGSPYVLVATLWGENAEREPPGYYYIVKRWCGGAGMFVCGSDGVVRWVPGGQ